MSDKIVSNLGCMDRSNPKFNWPWDEERRLRGASSNRALTSFVIEEMQPMTEEDERQLSAYFQLRDAERRMFVVRQRETSFAGAAGSGPDGVTG